MLNIRLYDKNDLNAWNSYVMNHPQGTVFHLIQWKNVIEKTFGHKACYLIAEDNSINVSNGKTSTVGILPLFKINSILFGNYFVSVPFAETGGPIADSQSALKKLVDRAIKYSIENRVDYLELRNIKPVANNFKNTVTDWFRIFRNTT